MSTTSQNARHEPKLCVDGVNVVGVPGTAGGTPELAVTGPAGGIAGLLVPLLPRDSLGNENTPTMPVADTTRIPSAATPL